MRWLERELDALRSVWLEQPPARRAAPARPRTRRARRSARRRTRDLLRGRRPPRRDLGGARAALLPARRGGVGRVRRRRLRALGRARRAARERRAGVPRRRAGVLRASRRPRFGRGGLDTAAAWCALGRELAATSREAGGDLLPHAPRRCCARADGLDALARVGRGRPRPLRPARLAGRVPRAGLLRRRAAARCRRSHPERLSAVGRRRRGALSGGEGARVLRPPAARRCSDWSDDEQARFLRTAIALAAPRAEGRRCALYRELPAVARAPRRRRCARRCCACLRRPASGWPASPPTSRRSPARCCTQVPRGARGSTRWRASSASPPRCPDGGGRRAARRCRASTRRPTPAQVARLVRRAASRSPRDNRDAGVAYFALESRTSLKVLRAASTAATLEEVQGLLRKYVQMLSGAPASVRAARAAARCGRRWRSSRPRTRSRCRCASTGCATHEDNLRALPLPRRAARRPARVRHLRLRAAGGATIRTRRRAARCSRYLTRAGAARGCSRSSSCSPRASASHAPPVRRVPRPGAARDAGSPSSCCARWATQPAPSRAQRLDALFALRRCAAARRRRCPAWLDGDGAALIAPLRRAAGRAAARRSTTRCASPRRWPARSPPASRRTRRAIASSTASLLDRITGDALLDPYVDDDEPAGRRRGAARCQRRRGRRRDAAEPTEHAARARRRSRTTARGGAAPISPEELQAPARERRQPAHHAGRRRRTSRASASTSPTWSASCRASSSTSCASCSASADARPRRAPRRWRDERGDGASFCYDEWDYHIGDYRSAGAGCRDRARGRLGRVLQPDARRLRRLIPEVRRQFQRIRPEMYRIVHGLEDGEDFDLNAVDQRRASTARAGRRAVAEALRRAQARGARRRDALPGRHERLDRRAASTPSERRRRRRRGGAAPARRGASSTSPRRRW